MPALASSLEFVADQPQYIWTLRYLARSMLRHSNGSQLVTKAVQGPNVFEVEDFKFYTREFMCAGLIRLFNAFL